MTSRRSPRAQISRIEKEALRSNVIEYMAEDSGRFGIAIVSLGTRHPRFRVFSQYHDLEGILSPANSIRVPADASGAMAVGAIHPWDWVDGRIADYSSRGPTTDGRVKPDITAPSGVSTESYGVWNALLGTGGYFGTSAAAPHVAGAAALIKSANPILLARRVVGCPRRSNGRHRRLREGQQYRVRQVGAARHGATGSHTASDHFPVSHQRALRPGRYHQWNRFRLRPGHRQGGVLRRHRAQLLPVRQLERHPDPGTGTDRCPHRRPAGHHRHGQRHRPADRHLALGLECLPAQRQDQHSRHRDRQQLRRFTRKQLREDRFEDDLLLLLLVELHHQVPHSGQYAIRQSQRSNLRRDEQLPLPRGLRVPT